METKTTTTKKAELIVNANDLSNLPKLPATMETLQFLRTSKNASDKDVHQRLDKAFAECKKADFVLLLERVMLHMGDVSRQHNLLKELGIISTTGGAQERAMFRSCLRWWEKNLPESFAKHLNVFVEYTIYENLMYYRNTTNRETGTLVKTEVLFPMPKIVYEFLAFQIRAGKDLNLIARHLPKYYDADDTHRTTKKKVKLRPNQKDYKWKLPEKSWVKVNGEFVKGTHVTVTAGDIISYPRKKQSFVIDRQNFTRKWIEGFCKTMGWTISDYKNFRKLQNTPEQSFSSKSIMSITESDFTKMLDRLTAGQRFRVAKMIAYKDSAGQLHSHTKWNELGQWYINWENHQEKIANELRKAAAAGDETKKDELMKQFKVKATGMQTIDLLAELFKGGLNETQINNTYQALIEKMDLIANVFPIVDGSGSMNSGINYNGVHITHRQIVYAMCIAFSTRNPVPEFQNTYGWFSNHFEICGRSQFVNDAPNPHLSKKAFTRKVEDHQVISPEKTFTDNLRALAAADPGHVANTNMFASIEYFVNLVKNQGFHVEQLPSALLYLTDNENNSGRSPQEAVNLAASIGWYPLLIFWGISAMSHDIQRQFKSVPNALFVGGFNEGVLSQILRGIKSGAINPEVELWTIYNDIRYSVISID